MRNVHMVVLLLLFSVCCYASDGTLDPSFGAGAGFVDAPVGFVAARVGLQTDGKIVVIGFGPIIQQLVRYNTDGTLDSSFGFGGSVTAPVNTFFNNLVIQPDGNIVVVGSDIGTSIFLLVRYLTNGSLDNTFGSGGIIIGPSGSANAVGLQADGRIIAAGNDASGNFGVVRYNIDGTIDVVFATGPDGIAGGIVIQPDGKAVVAGQSNSGNFEVARYNTDGTFDATFGVGGIATGPAGRLGNVLLQSDGAILLAGFDFPANPVSFQIARFTTSGVLDATYGVGGVATAFSDSVGSYALLQSDDKVVLVGADSVIDIFKLARFTITGIPDITFGVGGLTTVPTGDGSGTALQSDGKIIAAGASFPSANFRVARYIGGPALIPTTITFPRNGSRFAANATVSFRGAAQGQSMVYLFLDGVLVAGTATDPVNNKWAITQAVSNNSGTHTVSAVAVYANGNVDILSDPVVFTVTGGGCS